MIKRFGVVDIAARLVVARRGARRLVRQGADPEVAAYTATAGVFILWGVGVVVFLTIAWFLVFAIAPLFAAGSVPGSYWVWLLVSSTVIGAIGYSCLHGALVATRIAPHRRTRRDHWVANPLRIAAVMLLFWPAVWIALVVLDHSVNDRPSNDCFRPAVDAPCR